jgi:hypothetical protein
MEPSNCTPNPEKINHIWNQFGECLWWYQSRRDGQAKQCFHGGGGAASSTSEDGGCHRGKGWAWRRACWLRISWIRKSEKGYDLPLENQKIWKSEKGYDFICIGEENFISKKSHAHTHGTSSPGHDFEHEKFQIENKIDANWTAEEISRKKVNPDRDEWTTSLASQVPLPWSRGQTEGKGKELACAPHGHGRRSGGRAWRCYVGHPTCHNGEKQ